ncbi:hypothetical protein niasHS_000666 [Heterodera schachtii]|uniref:Uncharacterized protein n=1 Tax=Heterodera schachtii TaxID=97005 RepID=A0ABD2K4W9_HETSC
MEKEENDRHKCKEKCVLEGYLVERIGWLKHKRTNHAPAQTEEEEEEEEGRRPIQSHPIEQQGKKGEKGGGGGGAEMGRRECRNEGNKQLDNHRFYSPYIHSTDQC